MSKKEKKLLRRIVIAGVIFGISLPFHFMEVLPVGLELIIFLGAYIIIGIDILWKAVRGITRGQVFDENFLMTIATIGAFFLGDYAEGVAVMLFYQVGELFSSYAVSKSRRSIADLMDIRPDYANIMQDGVLVQVDPEEIKVDDIIIVKPGERIPLDGIIKEGFSSLDTKALTGESIPREAAPGESVISGCINQTGKLTIKVSKEFAESTVSKILELVENASDKKSKSENFITRFARYYTPVVVAAAASLAILPPLITGGSFSLWIERALTFLVISCPCALVISVPLSFFGGIGGASKSGVLIKGSNYLEALARTEIAVFDKTGTLTKGNFVVSEIKPNHISKTALLRIAAYAEDYSSHPIAMSIKKAYGKTIDTTLIKDIAEIAGQGVKAIISDTAAIGDFVTDREILAGNQRLMQANHISYDDTMAVGTIVYLAIDGAYAGSICIEDEIKPDARQALLDLKAAGVRQTVMLTGDNDAVGREVAAKLKLDEAYTELLPADKVEQLEKLMVQKSKTGMLAFVGDGINDAPVLARADIGIAMGGLGSDAAIEAADVVIMTDEPSKIVTAMKISKKTLRIVQQNIVFALGVKGIVLILGALGFATMWAAVFADVGVSVIAIINSMRALNVKKFQNTADPKEESRVAVKQVA